MHTHTHTQSLLCQDDSTVPESDGQRSELARMGSRSVSKPSPKRRPPTLVVHFGVGQVKRLNVVGLNHMPKARGARLKCRQLSKCEFKALAEAGLTPTKRCTPLPPSTVKMTQAFGTPRVFPATHYSPLWMTRRGAHELPQNLRCSDIFRSAVGDQCLRTTDPLIIVNPLKAEHLVGLPPGWTSTEPPPPQPPTNTVNMTEALSRNTPQTCVWNTGHVS